MDVALRGGEHDVEPLASLIQAHTLPEARTLMNGGLCERLFQFAKMELDRRSDPAAPLVELTKQDIVKACDNLPPPPSHDPGGSLSGGGSAGVADAAELIEVRMRLASTEARAAAAEKEAAALREQLLSSTRIREKTADAAELARLRQEAATHAATIAAAEDELAQLRSRLGNGGGAGCGRAKEETSGSGAGGLEPAIGSMRHEQQAIP